MPRPKTGHKTAAEYQKAYRERKQEKDWQCQTNWMLDAQLTQAIRAEANLRGIHESQLAEEILTHWYEARFEGLPFRSAT